MKKFLSNSAIVSGLLLLSKILGFVRDLLLARFFGTNASMQAFIIAFRLPEFMRKFSSSGVFTQIINPHISVDQHSPEQKIFIATTLYLIAVMMLFISIPLMFYSSLWTDVYAYGLLGDYEMLSMVRSMFIIMLPYVLFSCIVGLVSAVLNSYKKYIVSSLIPIILNVVMIVGIVISSRFNTPIYIVAYSVLIAGFIQFLVALYFLSNVVGRIQLKSTILLLRDSQSIKFLKNLPISFLGTAMLQIGSLVETFFATFLVSGSLAWLYYADRVNQFLYGVVGTAIATVMIPYLMKCKNDKNYFYNTLSWILSFTFLIVAPAIIGLMVLSKPIVISLFYYGKFTWVDVNHTQLAILGYSLSLFCFVYIRVVVSALYVLNKTRVVFLISMGCLLATVILDSICVYFYSHDAYGFMYLAIISSFIALVNLCIQVFMLSGRSMRTLVHVFLPFVFLLKISVSCIFMLLILQIFNLNDSYWIGLTMSSRIINLLMIVSVGVISYLCALEVLGVRKSLKLSKLKLNIKILAK